MITSTVNNREMDEQEIRQQTNIILWECDKDQRLLSEEEQLVVSSRIKRLRELTEYNEREILWIERFKIGLHIKELINIV